MADRSIIQLHMLATDTFEFFGSPAALFDRYTAEDLLIAQKSLRDKGQVPVTLISFRLQSQCVSE